MSDFGLINRAFLKESSNPPFSGEFSGLVWQTCLRQIFLFDPLEVEKIELLEGNQLFIGLQAESFLAQVLCGLKSPLIGETEVFGQFKVWWKSIPEENKFKQKFKGRIEALFALVKTVRKETLCGHGSQSYGSLLRRHLAPGETVEVIGAGHLAREIIPWIQNKSTCRIWCRDPEKAKGLGSEVVNLKTEKMLSRVIVCAASLNHNELNDFMIKHSVTFEHKLFDFRSNSISFVPFLKLKFHKKLEDFSSQFESNRSEIEKKALEATATIQNWAALQESKLIVRPYGWEDL